MTTTTTIADLKATAEAACAAAQSFPNPRTKRAAREAVEALNQAKAAATTPTQLTIHYPARYAAEGGQGVTLPVIAQGHLHDETSAAMALLFVGEKWVIADSQGQVYAESPNPGHLADWLQEYAETLGAMHRRGEL